MTRTVTATEAKNRLGSLIRLVSEEGSPVVIESRRERVAILIPPDDYDDLLSLRKERQRREALESLRRYQETYASANSDLSEHEIEALADRASRDVVDALVESGKVHFVEQ